ncbi:MAG: CPBP family intramembrane metalloprotease [Williamsia sp.]|nr:CPBP family intramembrane metalloprotease [Williamsia sp.]
MNKWLIVLSALYGTDLVVCTIVYRTPYFRTLFWSVTTELFLGVLALLMVAVLYKDMRPLFSWKDFSVLKAAVYSGAAVLLAIAVNVIVQWVNYRIFHQDVHFYQSFIYLKYPKLAMILRIVLLPALFEEIAYRGVILESLLRLADRRRAIMIGAFLFAIIHMSFISFFWLVPFAIWLGNVRTREGTIWYGVFIHLFFNLTACAFELWG